MKTNLEKQENIFKSKYYAVNVLRGIINPVAYKTARQIKKNFTSPNVISVKGLALLKDTAFEYYPREEF